MLNRSPSASQGKNTTNNRAESALARSAPGPQFSQSESFTAQRPAARESAAIAMNGSITPRSPGCGWEVLGKIRANRDRYVSNRTATGKRSKLFAAISA